MSEAKFDPKFAPTYTIQLATIYDLVVALIYEHIKAQITNTTGEPYLTGVEDAAEAVCAMLDVNGLLVEPLPNEEKE